MKKIVFILVLVEILFFCLSIKAVNTRPEISGNYQQGQRTYTEEEGLGDDYLFREGWLKYKQKITSLSYYYFKIMYYENDYMTKDSYDSITYDLTGNLTYQLKKSLRIKTELGLRNKKYYHSVQKDYQSVGGNFEVFYTFEDNDLSMLISVKQEIYPSSDRDNLVSGFGLNWERDLWKGFSVHGRFNLTGQKYNVSSDLQDRLKRSFSFGFEYQL